MRSSHGDCIHYNFGVSFVCICVHLVISLSSLDLIILSFNLAGNNDLEIYMSRPFFVYISTALILIRYNASLFADRFCLERDFLEIHKRECLLGMKIY